MREDFRWYYKIPEELEIDVCPFQKAFNSKFYYDALAMDWMVGGYVWLNPPFSKAKPFLHKALQ